MLKPAGAGRRHHEGTIEGNEGMKANLAMLAAAAAVAAALPARPATLAVGRGERYEKPSQAAKAAKDGDTVVIAAGEYRGDVCAWRADNLSIRGAGMGKTVLDADGRVCMGKGLWVVCGTNTTIEGVAFRGATCPDGNGAGIRLDANGDLTIRSCSFEGNENGILTGPLDRSTVTVEKCRFRGNGRGDGYSHNLYVGAVKKLVFRDSASDHALRGHALKSRARETEILDSVFDDGGDGESSYLVNCPNGGRVSMRGCRLVQSPAASNGTMVSIGEEGAYPGTAFENEGNAFRNLRPQGGQEVVIRK